MSSNHEVRPSTAASPQPIVSHCPVGPVFLSMGQDESLKEFWGNKLYKCFVHLLAKPTRKGMYQHVMSDCISTYHWCICTWWPGHVEHDNNQARFLYTIKLHPWSPSSRGHQKPRDCRTAPLKPAVFRRDATWKNAEIAGESSEMGINTGLMSYIMKGQFRWDSQVWVVFLSLTFTVTW